MDIFQRRIVVAAGLVALPVSARAQGTVVAPGFSSPTLVASGLPNATAMEFAPDGRIFALDQTGVVRVVKNGAVLPTPFLTTSVNASGERGLLGIAFDPNYATNGYVYTYRTTQSGATVSNWIVRVTADPSNPDIALAGSEVEILRLENLSATNHNGGAIHFGPDGKLYVGVGDNAVSSNSQTLNNRLGKLLRINPDGSIPTDNPFYNTATGDNRAIWSLGLRNPYTFAIQPGTGTLHINDVGQGSWEEVNLGIAGSNYGWGSGGGANEGNFSPTGSLSAFTPPLLAYAHGGGTNTGMAITGAAFYNPGTTRTFAESFIGAYFFGDYLNGWIRYIDPSTPYTPGVSASSNLFLTGANLLVDIQVGDDGSLYYLSRGQGSIYKITGSFNVAVGAPEPGSLALLCLGALGILGRRRRR